MQLRGEVWALGDTGVSTSSASVPARGSRLVGAFSLGGSFSVPGSLQFQYAASLGEVSGPVSFSLPPTCEIDADVALAGG